VNPILKQAFLYVFTTLCAAASVYVAQNFVLAQLYSANKISPEHALLLGSILGCWIDLDEKVAKAKEIAGK
jgi:Na+/glutamate symporter